MIDVLALIESVEHDQKARAPHVDIVKLIEAIEGSSAGNPVPDGILRYAIGEAAERPICAINKGEDLCSPEKPRGSRQSWSPVALYCWQVSEGPVLSIRREVSPESLPLDWFEQHVRSISETVLKRFHSEAVESYQSGSGLKFPDPLPLQEARRLVKILTERVNRPSTTSREKAFLDVAIQRGLRYIDAWGSMTETVNRKIRD